MLTLVPHYESMFDSRNAFSFSDIMVSPRWVKIPRQCRTLTLHVFIVCTYEAMFQVSGVNHLFAFVLDIARTSITIVIPPTKQTQHHESRPESIVSTLLNIAPKYQ